MIVINQVKFPIEYDDKLLKDKAAKELRIPVDCILSVKILKRSVDARKKPDIFFSMSLLVDVSADQKKILDKHKKNNNILAYKENVFKMPDIGEKSLLKPPVIIGAGPAGIFCGMLLAQMGYKPILLERGNSVELRKKDVLDFWEKGILNTASNVQFGEGGAGTFSDGKLNTLVKDSTGKNTFVLEKFVEFGASPTILYDAKPHIGTDKLIDIVSNMRKYILDCGGNVRFNCTVKDFDIKDNKINALTINDGEIIETDCCVLAIGHSARDTFEILNKKGLSMEAKSFAVGFRVEHPREFITNLQYGKEMPSLGAAPYKLTAKTSYNRGVYSFCMCPGGYVVNSSSEENHLVVNGMSYSDRNARNSNSAIVISVNPSDFGESGPLAGISFQRNLEKKAFELGNSKIPQQLYGDFRENRISTSFGDFDTCTKGAYSFANLRSILKDELNLSFIEGMNHFDNIIPGFNRYDAILSGVESRTSSPVRINRNEYFESNIFGIYPCGEGAGYAGGITSAAMDGVKVAEAIIKKYKPVY